MPEASGDDMNRSSSQQQRCRVDVPQIMQPRVRQGFIGVRLVVSLIRVAMSDDTVSGWTGSPQAVQNT